MNHMIRFGIDLAKNSFAIYGVRELIRLGHEARIIDPRFVAQYRHQGGRARTT